MSTTPRTRALAGGRILFMGSFPTVRRMPTADLPEVAFAGRSNVGKSSAINTLLNTRKAARVSGTPGRTQAINLFRIEERINFADLPGYGFAKVPQEVKAQWKGLIEGYLGGRKTLGLVVVLVDIRHAVSPLDAELIWGLRQARLPILVLATKADKLKRNPRQRQAAMLRRELRLKGGQLIPFSSLDGTGFDEAWAVLNRVAKGKDPFPPLPKPPAAATESP